MEVDLAKTDVLILLLFFAIVIGDLSGGLWANIMSLQWWSSYIIGFIVAIIGVFLFPQNTLAYMAVPTSVLARKIYIKRKNKSNKFN